MYTRKKQNQGSVDGLRLIYFIPMGKSQNSSSLEVIVWFISLMFGKTLPICQYAVQLPSVSQ